VTRLRRFGIGIVVPIVFFSVWWVLSENSTSPYFPPLRRSLTAFFDIWFFARFFTDLLPSLSHFLSGLALGAVSGVVVGTLMGLFPRFSRDVSPMTEFVRAIPTAALVPLGLVLFGTGFIMETFLISLAVFFPILVSTTAGVRGVDPVYLEVARSYGLSFSERLWRVIIPAAAPQIFAGCRVAIAFGLAATVIANMVASGSGLGFFIVDAQTSFRLPDMWAGLIMIGLLGYLANTAFVLVEHRLLAWHRGWRGASEAARAAA
jgi:ABC-type nitrate/sulfonate/bicarbonate transport system permease component